MNHPVFQSRKSIIIYFAAWTIIMAVHAVVQYAFYTTDLSLAVFDSLVSGIAFSLLGLAIWYIVHFSKPASNNQINIFINQLTSLVILLFFWIGLCLMAYYIFHGRERAYMDYFHASVPGKIIGGIFYYFILALIFYLIVYYRNLSEKQLKEVELRGLLKESELNVLKSQINPHFLFNSLNSISSLIMYDPDKSQEMIIKLSDFLRYTISEDTEKFTKLEKEIENIRLYLDIEKTRFGDKLQYDFQLEEACLKRKLPFMILQPLYENAVKHAVYESTENILIKTSCITDDNGLTITIENNYQQCPLLKKGAGLGLKNIRERLCLIYHSENLLQTLKTDTYFKVILQIPCES